MKQKFGYRTEVISNVDDVLSAREVLKYEMFGDDEDVRNFEKYGLVEGKDFTIKK